MKELIAGLAAMRQRALEGMAEALEAEAAALTQEMLTSPRHGDVAGATHANYSARVVGLGRDGAELLAEARRQAAEYNPNHVAPTESISISGPLGVIVDDQMDYAVYRERANAGQYAVLGPTIRSEGDRLTAAAARGSKKALT